MFFSGFLYGLLSQDQSMYLFEILFILENKIGMYTWKSP